MLSDSFMHGVGVLFLNLEVLLNKDNISVVNWKRLIEVVHWKAVPIDVLV